MEMGVECSWENGGVLTVERCCTGIENENGFKPIMCCAEGSREMAGIAAYGSRFVVRGSWFVVGGPQFGARRLISTIESCVYCLLRSDRSTTCRM